MRQMIRFNPDCIARVRAAQTKPAPALRTNDSPEKTPSGGRHGKSPGVFRARHHKLAEERVQIRRVDARVALREEGRVYHGTTTWLPALPDTIKSNMILEVLTDTGQMLHDRDACAT